MATSVDILARFFGAVLSQGLSGGGSAPVDPAAAGSPLAARIRRHRRDGGGGVGMDANAVWTHGLREHLRAERPDGICWTDVVVVLAHADDPGPTLRQAMESDLAERHAAWARAERLPLRRAARVRVLIDGLAPHGDGPRLGLASGDFVTALSPSVHLAGTDTTATMIVHACLPSEGSEYREIGRLHDDQLLFTVGNHWLDTFRHESIAEPCAWIVHRKADGTTVHQVCPALQHLLATHAHLDPASGVNVVTLATRAGEPLLHVVLVDVEPPADLTRPRVRKVSRAAARTVVPDDVGVRALTLHERGALLQKVHFGAFMDGYDVHIGEGGTISTRMDAPHATLQVRGTSVALVARVAGVTFDGIPVPVGAPVPLDGPITIGVDGHALGWQPLTDVTADGWPYLAEVRRPGGGATLPFGGHHRIGRDRRCAVRLPDEPWNGNIAWKSSVGSGAVIRSRSGDIPKSKFYIDSIMVASEHAEIDLSLPDGAVSGIHAADPTKGALRATAPVLRSLARQCYTYLRRGGEVLTLYPRDGARSPTEQELLPGDELLVGNCLYEVQYAAADSPLSGAPPILTLDVPFAHALGDRGGAPPRPPLAATERVPNGLDAVEPRAGLRPDPPRARASVEEIATVMLGEGAPTDLVPPPLPPLEGDVLAISPHEAAAERVGAIRLVLQGWSVGAELHVGNHLGSGAAIPEIATAPDASFLPTDSLVLHADADGVRAEVLALGEASILVDGVEVERTEDARTATLRIVRRDASYEPLLEVELRLAPDPAVTGGTLLVPSDPFATGLGVRAFPYGQWRRTRAGATALAGYWDGARLHLREIGEGTVPVATAHGTDTPWVDAAEDSVTLAPGDRVRLAQAVWRLDVGGNA